MKDFNFVTADGIPNEFSGDVRWETVVNKTFPNCRCILYKRKSYYPRFFKLQIIDFKRKKEEWEEFDIEKNEDFEDFKKTVKELFGIEITGKCRQCEMNIDMFDEWARGGLCFYCHQKMMNDSKFMGKLLNWNAPKITEKINI